MKTLLNPGTTYTVNGRSMVYRFKLMVRQARVAQYWFFDTNGFSTSLLEHEVNHKTVRI